MAKLGFIGLSKMGGRIAKRLIDAGHMVIGYNRTPSKVQWLQDAGMQWGASPRAVAAQADSIFTMVTNTAALREVLDGTDGLSAGLQPGKVFIDMSTISANASREIAEQVAALGAQMLDAPVSGNVLHVEKGTTPMRWIETQSPQPPNQQGFRFPADWAYLAAKLNPPGNA
jgi:3-hydroxyisobutyrate dehydrogenase-like beta-hydroxyacid dehydrogenase